VGLLCFFSRLGLFLFKSRSGSGDRRRGWLILVDVFGSVFGIRFSIRFGVLFRWLLAVLRRKEGWMTSCC